MQKSQERRGKDILYQAARAAVRGLPPPLSAIGLAADLAKAHPEEIKGGVRALGRGVPLWGGAQDEVFAAADATFGGDRGKGWLERWDSAVEEQRAYDAAFDEKHPIASAALLTAGGFAVPGALALRAGRLLPGAIRTANNLPGGRARSLLDQSVTGARNGIGTGILDGFANGTGGLGSRLENAERSLRRGLGWGGAVPFLSRGPGKAVGRHAGPGAAANTTQWATGILGNIDPDGPVGGLIPMPVLDLPPPEKRAPR